MAQTPARMKLDYPLARWAGIASLVLGVAFLGLAVWLGLWRDWVLVVACVVAAALWFGLGRSLLRRGAPELVVDDAGLGWAGEGGWRLAWSDVDDLVLQRTGGDRSMVVVTPTQAATGRAEVRTAAWFTRTFSGAKAKRPVIALTVAPGEQVVPELVERAGEAASARS